MTEEEIPEKKPLMSVRFVLTNSLKLINHNKKLFALVTLSSYVFFFTPLAMALAIREIFNILTETPDFNFSINQIIWIIPVVFFFQMMTEISFRVFVFRFNLSNGILLRKNMIKGVFKQPGANALEKSPGESISRFRGDIESIVWMTSLIGDITAFMTFAVVAFFLMFDINQRVTLITFIPFIVVVIVINISKGRIIKYNDAARTAAGRVTGSVAESFGSIQGIKVASAEEHVFEHFRKLNDTRREAAVKDSSLQAILRSFGQIVVSISTGVILFLVGGEMQRGEFTIGDFTLFAFLLNWLTGFIRFLGEFLAWIQRNKVSYGRIVKIMQGNTNSPEAKHILTRGPIYVDEKYPPIPPLKRDGIFEKLEVRDLTYLHGEAGKGIKNVNLVIPKGSFTVIVGRVGSGKSTLLRSVLGLLPASGDVLWNGEKVNNPAEFMISPKIAYTSQVPILFSDSIKENLLLGLPEDSVSLDNATKLAVVDKEIEGFENELETFVGPKGVRLSGGQKHRIAAARMFVRDPDILVFDDLSSALDVATEEKLWEGLFKNPNATFLVTSHRKYVLNRADNIIVLKEGKILDQGRIHELLERSEEMRNLWDGKIEEMVPAAIADVIDHHYKLIPHQTNLIEYRGVYPTYLLERFQRHVTAVSIPVSIKIMFKDLVDLAFLDHVISEEEEEILHQITSDVSIYGALLDKLISSGYKTPTQLEELRKLREIIYSNAYQLAAREDELSHETIQILERLQVIIQELQLHE